MIHRIMASALALCIAWAFCLAGFAAGRVPQLLNYQGKLADGRGTPVDGSKEMVFEFYDSAKGHDPLEGFSERQQVVVTAGIFNALIGSATEGGVPASVFHGASVYLSVTVEREELLPRQRIVSVAYAFRSDDAGSVGGVTASAIQAALAELQSRLVALEQHGLAPQCYVPAGQFMASTGVGVYLDGYFIDTYEVTNELYCRFLNAGGNDDHWHSTTDGPPYEQQIIKNGAGSYSVAPGTERRPARYVSWEDAVAFCDWRSEAEGLPVGTHHLPTEAQWEKAAGWTPGRTTLWTYAIQSDTIDCGSVNYGSCVGRTTDVGSYSSTSYYGCHDMSGNLTEWCSDWHQPTYPSGTLNPIGPGTGTHRVMRGASWGDSEGYCRVGTRNRASPSGVFFPIGFRCARTSE